MFVSGHIGCSLVLHRGLGLSLVPVLIGGMGPDIIDKPLDLLGVTDTGRLWGHNLTTWGVLTLLAILILGRQRGLSLSLGFIGHLLADLFRPVPLFYPWVEWTAPASSGVSAAEVVTDVSVFGVGLILTWRSIRSRAQLKAVGRTIARSLRRLPLP